MTPDAIVGQNDPVTPLKLRHHVRKLPAGDLIVRVSVFLLGLAFIVLGLALSVLPGPFTIPPILIGLLIWSLEFAWAERWLDRAKIQAQEAWTAAKHYPVRTGLVTTAGIALLVAAALLLSHYGVVDRVRDVIT